MFFALAQNQTHWYIYRYERGGHSGRTSVPTHIKDVITFPPETQPSVLFMSICRSASCVPFTTTWTASLKSFSPLPQIQPLNDNDGSWGLRIQHHRVIEHVTLSLLTSRKPFCTVSSHMLLVPKFHAQAQVCTGYGSGIVWFSNCTYPLHVLVKFYFFIPPLPTLARNISWCARSTLM